MHTYEELKAAIGRWLKRTNLDEYIPDFIELAEVRLNRSLRVRQMQKAYTCVTGDRQIALPEDYLEAVSVRLDGRQLDFVQHHLVDETSPEREQFSIVGRWLYLHALPQSSYPVRLKLEYYARLPSLTADNPSNWLLAEGPDIYLYAALLEAEPYIKNDQRILIWREALAIALSDMQVHDERARFSGAPLIIRRA